MKSERKETLNCDFCLHPWVKEFELIYWSFPDSGKANTKKTLFDVTFFKEKRKSLCFIGCWPFALHWPEWMDTCKLRFVVSRSVWRRWWITKECAYGCDQGQAAGKNLWVNVTGTPSQFPDVLSEAQCCLADVSLGFFRML